MERQLRRVKGKGMKAGKLLKVMEDGWGLRGARESLPPALPTDGQCAMAKQHEAHPNNEQPLGRRRREEEVWKDLG